MFILAFLLQQVGVYAQSIPSIGQNNQLEIANWNLEWFGKTANGYGPSNDSLQQHLIAKVIAASEIDIWALCEVSNSIAFDTLCKRLPKYSGLLSTYLPEQKTALLFKASDFKMVSKKQLGVNQSDSFSTLRFPLEVILVPSQNSSIDTLKLLIIHLKANTGNDSQKMLAYNSRRRSSEWLNSYIYQQSSKAKVMILGDWNDDLDQSIFNGLPSPFSAIINNNKGHFISKRLSDLQESTTVTYPEPIDHQWVSKSLLNYWLPDSVRTWQLQSLISNYAQLCSDHLPVYSKYNWHVQNINKPEHTSIKLWPNPCQHSIHIETDERIISWQIINNLGQLIQIGNTLDNGKIPIVDCLFGIYALTLNFEQSHYTVKLMIEQ